jgi:hypothetical protein
MDPCSRCRDKRPRFMHASTECGHAFTRIRVAIHVIPRRMRAVGPSMKVIGHSGTNMGPSMKVIGHSVTNMGPAMSVVRPATSVLRLSMSVIHRPPCLIRARIHAIRAPVSRHGSPHSPHSGTKAALSVRNRLDSPAHRRDGVTNAADSCGRHLHRRASVLCWCSRASRTRAFETRASRPKV